MKKMRTAVLAGLLLLSVGAFADRHYILTSCGYKVEVSWELSGDQLADLTEFLDDYYCS